MSKCLPSSFAIPAAMSGAGRSSEALRMDISARWGGEWFWFEECVTVIERKCRRVFYTVLAVAGCGESGIVEFTLCGVDVC